MRNFTDWEEMNEQYAQHIPSFLSLVEYLVIQLFRYLFGRDGGKVFAWYHYPRQRNNRMTQTIIEHILSFKNKVYWEPSAKVCFLQVHNFCELREVLKYHPDLLDEATKALDENNGANETDGSVTTTSCSTKSVPALGSSSFFPG